MPTRIVLFASRAHAVAQHGEPLPVGTMYPSDDYNHAMPEGRSLLSPEYRAQRAHLRDPLFVVLPDGCDFCVDSVTIKDGVPGLTGWTVTDDGAAISLAPSVNIKGGWHGFIANGAISDDVSGRAFDYPRRPQ